jgi:hypothetical protein
MAWNATLLDFSGTLSDGNRIDDLSRRPAWGATFRIAHTPPCPKMSDQLFFEHSASLNKQIAIDSFVGQPQAFVGRKCSLEPPRHLFGRPIKCQLFSNPPS